MKLFRNLRIAVALAAMPAAPVCAEPGDMYSTCYKLPIYDQRECFRKIDSCLSYRLAAGLAFTGADRNQTIYSILQNPFGITRQEAIDLVDSATEAMLHGGFSARQDFIRAKGSECLAHYGFDPNLFASSLSGVGSRLTMG